MHVPLLCLETLNKCNLCQYTSHCYQTQPSMQNHLHLYLITDVESSTECKNPQRVTNS